MCLKECIQKCENTFAEWFLVEHVLNFVEQYSSALFSHLSSSVLLPQFDQHQFVNALAVAGCDHDVGFIVMLMVMQVFRKVWIVYWLSFCYTLISCLFGDL